MPPVIAQTGPSSNGVVGDLSWKRFIAGGSEGVQEAVVLEGGHRVKLSWVDGHESEFSLKWLRDHGDGSFNVSTQQRKIDTFSMSNATRVSHASLETTSSGANDPSKDTDERPQQVLRLRWDADANTTGDEEECTVPVARLRQHCSSETARILRRQLGTMTGVEIPDPTPVLWGNGVLSSSASGNSSIRFEYNEVMEGDQQSSSSAASELRGALKSHGLALVRGVPVESAATQALGLKMGGRLMSTLFGDTVWGISIEALDPATAFRDVAYTTGGLQLHTDQSYMSEPPGLQVFSCHVPASEGGASTYVDGFAVAERLRKENPEAFEFFTTTPITYHYFDDKHHHVSEGPLFQTDASGAVVQVRFHDSYRAPLDYLSTDDIDRFYEHHESLMAMTRDPSMVERILLQPGDTMIFNNHRALHGRDPYKGSRRMVGCYVGKDESKSEARMRGF